MIDIEPPSIQTSFFGEEENITIEVTPRASEEQKQAKLRKRVKKTLKREPNKLCIECSKPNPRWAAILCVPSAHGGSEIHYSRTFLVGGFCCLECSGAHRRLGTHISFVRSIDLDTLKEHEVEALESGGNDIVNSIFEGYVLDGSEKLDPESSQKDRETFIRNKYEKKKYLDIKNLAQFRLNMIQKESVHNLITSPLSFTSSPSSAEGSRVASPQQQLQIFTSSPRTLAMIEKYMNPKPKKKGLNRMKFSFKRFSRKRRFKGDIRNLQGVINVNPNLNVIETRSDYCPSPGSEIDGETGSITSTRSSMSAAIRRKIIQGKRILTPRMKDYSLGKKTPTSKAKNTHTPRRRNFFGRKQCIKLTDYPAEELQNFDTKKDIFSPSPTTSNDSPRRSRLSHLLRTPKLANSKSKVLTPNQETIEHSTEYFFADSRDLKVVKESDSTDTADEDAADLKEDIKALRAWSKKFDNVLTKVFKQKKSQKKMDQVTLLP
mmetsp:Transcript_9718/g.18243  ORF Transcript_9718/g.18243 Transcript_9718/m.18243 type:complete len:490 (+) Transcript_9718:189-1658(+)|eukprot:CAMPEP_0176496916 /NCGR_PEP_ID=MMETSP0200_2-20121128/11443_1 /TAXON_ID=947934 /ORGANISM="Chaetoceros sp., Strain GSL56" /LENGTH=489 /DNA_ID=CAMNT_0017894889 /DNA_START=93 /DNA_END=1562 /DNA_ORIENTATION=+